MLVADAGWKLFVDVVALAVVCSRLLSFVYRVRSGCCTKRKSPCAPFLCAVGPGRSCLCLSRRWLFALSLLFPVLSLCLRRACRLLSRGNAKGDRKEGKGRECGCDDFNAGALLSPTILLCSGLALARFGSLLARSPVSVGPGGLLGSGAKLAKDTPRNA